MYCTAVFCLLWMYSSIASNAASSLSAASEVYSQLLSARRHRILHINLCITWSWNPPQDPSHVGGNHSCFCAENQYRLNHVLKEKSGQPWLRPLPDEDPRHPLPHHPHLCQVSDHHQQIVVQCRYQPPQVSTGGHHLQEAPICDESPRCDQPLLLHFQAPSLPVLHLIALFGALIQPLQRPPWHQHVTQRTMLVGEVAFLKYHRSVPEMPVL